MSGELTHVEIGVRDPQQAQQFFGQLLGWTFEETAKGAHIGGAGVAGAFHRDEEPWVQVFFSVPDLEAAVKRVVELGGEVAEGSSEGASGRWIHSCRDDQGTPFGLHEPPKG